MIPLEFLSKVGIYDVDFTGHLVKTRVVAEITMVERALKELKASISSTRLVGIDILPATASWSDLTNILVLLAGASCVIFQLRLIKICPAALETFLSDQTICFVGLEPIDRITCFGSSYTHDSKFIKVVQLAVLAGRIIKKPSICNYRSLVEIAEEIGHGVEVPYCPIGSKISYNMQVFSAGEVKVMIHKSYACWFIASKLFSILSEDDGSVKNQVKSVVSGVSI